MADMRSVLRGAHFSGSDLPEGVRALLAVLASVAQGSKTVSDIADALYEGERRGRERRRWEREEERDPLRWAWEGETALHQQWVRQQQRKAQAIEEAARAYTNQLATAPQQPTQGQGLPPGMPPDVAARAQELMGERTREAAATSQAETQLSATRRSKDPSAIASSIVAQTDPQLMGKAPEEQQQVIAQAIQAANTAYASLEAPVSVAEDAKAWKPYLEAGNRVAEGLVAYNLMRFFDWQKAEEKPGMQEITTEDVENFSRQANAAGLGALFTEKDGKLELNRDVSDKIVRGYIIPQLSARTGQVKEGYAVAPDRKAYAQRLLEAIGGATKLRDIDWLREEPGGARSIAPPGAQLTPGGMFNVPELGEVTAPLVRPEERARLAAAQALGQLKPRQAPNLQYLAPMESPYLQKPVPGRWRVGGKEFLDRQAAQSAYEKALYGMRDVDQEALLKAILETLERTSGIAPEAQSATPYTTLPGLR